MFYSWKNKRLKFGEQYRTLQATQSSSYSIYKQVTRLQPAILRRKEDHHTQPLTFCIINQLPPSTHIQYLQLHQLHQQPPPQPSQAAPQPPPAPLPRSRLRGLPELG
ncbi:hypothetical protein V6Z12_D11G246100 [Gossypium hirsutum]